MKIENVPFATTDWSAVPVTEAPGETGVVRARMVEAGSLRLRQVEFSANYRADHWCPRGHVVLVQQGALTVELGDGRRFDTVAGMSFHVADDDGEHMIYTATGATVFIVD
ncbi:MAG TPA: DHCW motif cupin fold protein [Aliidongia sp.]|uniref:DHCW motif cupin fold protein n=1 Tax=Aliidongia sp. TaxID=1914230 RepID=UPI002DDD5B5C|nr:DHCW motif cupin fold protein [Aliidongia sp.]HEV2674699.1 DHCW motif cupin fold protein [Aliidongia sp.]